MTTVSARAMTVATSAGAEEAAAIAAAIERFTHDTAPARAYADQALNPWTRAAVLEGVMHEEHRDVPHPWINT